jgi:hypothetical protein
MPLFYGNVIYLDTGVFSIKVKQIFLKYAFEKLVSVSK